MRIVSYLLSLFFTIGLAFGHAEGDEEGEDEGVPASIDCEHPPAAMKNALPEPIAKMAITFCTPLSQRIYAAPGWTWRFPGSYFDRPSIPAFSPEPSRSQPTGRYFTGFELSELGPAELEARHKAFAEGIATYPEGPPPRKILKLVATNDLGHRMDAYFGSRTEKQGWVVICAPDCAPEYLFLTQTMD